VVRADGHWARAMVRHGLAAVDGLRCMPNRIVTYAFRRRRQPRKKPKAAALAGPAILKVPGKQDRARQRDVDYDAAREASPEEDARVADLGGADDAATATDEADLPTSKRTLASRFVRVLLTCWHCCHQADADLTALIVAGRGDAPWPACDGATHGAGAAEWTWW